MWGRAAASISPHADSDASRSSSDRFELPNRAHARWGNAKRVGLIGMTLIAAGIATNAVALDTTAERLQAVTEEAIAAEDSNIAGAVVHVSQPGVGSWSWAAGVVRRLD